MGKLTPHLGENFKQNFKDIRLHQLDWSLREHERGCSLEHCLWCWGVGVMWVAITEKVNKLDAMDSTYHVTVRTNL